MRRAAMSDARARFPVDGPRIILHAFGGGLRGCPDARKMTKQ